MTAHLGPVMHVQVGNGDCYGEFSNPGNEASSTGWIPKSGQLAQYVDADLIAWTQAAGNSTYNGFECEGFPNEPLTNEQILTFARVYAAGHLHYGWPFRTVEVPGQAGFAWHGMGGAAWGGHTGCPGDIRKAQRGAILYIASLTVLDPAIPPTTAIQETTIMGLPSGCTDDGAVNDRIRELWNLYRTDPMTGAEQQICRSLFHLPASQQWAGVNGFGGNPDALHAFIVDDAKTKGHLKPEYASAV
jgi:hypothetical protein